MQDISEMTAEEIAEILKSKGWEVEDDRAYLSIDCSKQTTDGDLQNVFWDDYGGYRKIFTDNIYMDYELDLSERTATYEAYYGPKTGSEVTEEDDFEGTVLMEVECVGPLPIEKLVRSDNRMRHCWTDLVRVTRDYANDLYDVEEGEYLLEGFPNVNVEPGQATSYYRISNSDARRILDLSEKDVDLAVEEMERIADEMEDNY